MNRGIDLCKTGLIIACKLQHMRKHFRYRVNIMKTKYKRKVLIGLAQNGRLTIQIVLEEEYK